MGLFLGKSFAPVFCAMLQLSTNICWAEFSRDLEISSKCSMAAIKNTSLCKLHDKGTKGLRPMGSNATINERGVRVPKHAHSAIRHSIGPVSRAKWIIVDCKPISHLRVPPGLCIKTRLSAQTLIWKWFFIHKQIKLIFARKVCTCPHFGFWNSEVAYHGQRRKIVLCTFLLIKLFAFIKK